MKQEKICGIYCIKNIINNRKYIGQSVDIKKRHYEHLRQLRKNEHKNIILQTDFNKYLENSFIFSILEEIPQEDLNEREIYWIKQYDTYRNGYNMTHGGDINSMTYEPIKEKCRKKLIGNKNWLGKHHTEETKQLMSNQAKGRKMSQESRKKLSTTRIKLGLGGQYGDKNPLSKKVNQIDVNTGEIINTFESIHSAEVALSPTNRGTGNIFRVLSGKNKTAYGSYWEYA